MCQKAPKGRPQAAKVRAGPSHLAAKGRVGQVTFSPCVHTQKSDLQHQAVRCQNQAKEAKRDGKAYQNAPKGKPKAAKGSQWKPKKTKGSQRKLKETKISKRKPTESKGSRRNQQNMPKEFKGRIGIGICVHAMHMHGSGVSWVHTCIHAWGTCSRPSCRAHGQLRALHLQHTHAPH